MEIHRQAALELERATPTTSSEISELVRHWAVVAAVDPAATTSGARWAVRAGDAAAAAAATDEAISCYQQAVALWSGPTAEHADTLVRLGTVLSASGRQAEADDEFRAALLLAEGIGDAELLARAALGLSATVRYGHSDAERVAALETAIERLGPDDDVLRPAALAMLMRQLGFDPSPRASSRRQEAAALVLQAVSRRDPPAELLLALGSARDSIPVDDPIPLGRLTRQIIDVASVRRDLRVLANAWYGQAWSTLELGDAVGWADARAGYASVAEELRLPHELAQTATMEATAALIEGRYADAEASAERALSQASATGDDNAGAVYMTNAALRGLDLGQAADVVALMRAVQDDYVNVPTFTAGLTLAAAVAGELTPPHNSSTSRPSQASRASDGTPSGCRSSGCSATLAPSSAVPTMRNDSTSSWPLRPPRRCGSGHSPDGGGPPTTTSAPSAGCSDATTKPSTDSGLPSRSNRPCMPGRSAPAARSSWPRCSTNAGVRPGVVRRASCATRRSRPPGRSARPESRRRAREQLGTGKHGDPPRRISVLQQAVRLGSFGARAGQGTTLRVMGWVVPSSRRTSSRSGPEVTRRLRGRTSAR